MLRHLAVMAGYKAVLELPPFLLFPGRRTASDGRTSGDSRIKQIEQESVLA